MTKPETELFTRSEALAGLPARRAQAALFLIESRTAHLVARARQDWEPFLGETTAAERDLAFMEAFASGKAPPLRPTIQDLEQYAAAWRDLAPDTPRARAALAHLLGQKYQFTAAATPGLTAALGLDEPAVGQAYEKLYGEPLATIYAAQPGLAERLRWAWAGLGRWLEHLPPFWTVFALTLTETVGAGILALPIALAGVGPLPGVVILVLLGLVNMLTIAAEAEAVGRSGAIRYGNAFLGRMVGDYLGRAGAQILSAGCASLVAIVLLAYYVGFAATLADAIGLPPGIWAAGLFLVVLFFLRRETLNATVTSALVVGAVNLTMLLFISLLAFSRLRPENLLYMNVPLLNGRPFDVGILGLIFGIVLGAYFGHLSVGNCARLVLRRDASARSLIRGAVAAQTVVLFLYCVWVLAVNSAVAPEILARQTGTALTPLATVVGPAARILGALYVILGVAMASVHYGLALFNLVRERLPRQSEPVVRLPRRQGRLILRPRTDKATTTVSLTYLGLTSDAAAPRPRFRLDVQQSEDLQRLEIVPADRWDETALRDRLPQLDRRLRLALTVQEAAPDSVRLQISTPLAVRYEGEWDTAGLRMADLLELPEETQRLLTWLMRRGEATAAEIAAYTGQDEEATRLMLTGLVEQGLLVEQPTGGASCYRPQLAFRRGRVLPDDLWRALDGETGEHTASGGPDKSRAPDTERGSSIRSGIPDALSSTPILARLGSRERFWLAASPAVILFLLAEALLWTDKASFSGLLSFIGVIIASLLAGIFPVLLLIASRRKGDFVPGFVYRVLGQPWLLGGLYLLFIAAIFLHGLVIWQNPLLRVCALLVGLLMVVATLMMVRQGAFAGRVVVEICEDLTPGPAPARQGQAAGRFAITALGRPAAAAVRLVYPAGERRLTATADVVPEFGDLCQASFDLPATAARDVKIWAHRITPDGVSESLPAVAEVRCGDSARTVDLRLTGGQAVLPVTGPGCRVTVRLGASDGA
jgi:amino acid permease